MRGSNIEDIFAKFPNEAYWKLFIDKIKWVLNDRYIFDKEESEGYFNNVSLALFINFLLIDEPVTNEFIIGLHSLAYHDKKAEGYEEGYVRAGISGLTNESFSIDGLKELLNKISCDVTLKNPFILRFEIQQADAKSHDRIASIDLDDNTKNVDAIWEEIQTKLKDKSTKLGLVRKSAASDVYQRTSNYIHRYNSEIESAGENNDKKLSAIVKFIQDMHQLHPFKDGNGRIFIFLILNKLLIQNKLSPTIIESPFIFTGHSIDELINHVKNGQNLFKDLCSSEGPVKSEKLLDYIRRIINITPEQEKEISDPLRDPLRDHYDPFYKAIAEGNYNNACVIFKSISSHEVIDFIDHCSALLRESKEEEVVAYVKYLAVNMRKLKDADLIEDEKFYRVLICNPERGGLLAKLANLLRNSGKFHDQTIHQFIISYVLALPAEKCLPENEESNAEECGKLGSLLEKANLFSNPKMIAILESRPSIINELASIAPILNENGQLDQLSKILDDYSGKGTFSFKEKCHFNLFPQSEYLTSIDNNSNQEKPKLG